MASNAPVEALYRTMRRIRSFEERVGELFVRGESAGSMLHLSIGEEGAAAGVGLAMRDGDTFTTHHRGHGIFLARGAEPVRMMAEIAGKATGYCAGKGGSMHIADMALGHLGANAIVGGGIPHVVGAGLAARIRGTGAASVAFFGDGAMQQGILYEAMNLAAVWDAPVLFVCINNQYGMGTRIDRATRSTEFALRARALGLEGAAANGADAVEVWSVAREMLDAARAGRPGLLSVDCYRFHGHARMDKSPYREAEEEASGRLRDPVAAGRAALLGDGWDEGRVAALDAEVAAEMDAALEAAVAAPAPEAPSLFRDVFARGTPEPEPQARRLARIFGEA